jgi:dienelactone hydrolase
MHTENMAYQQDGRTFHGFLAYDPTITGKRPTVLIAHAWAGRDEFPCEKAKMLAKLGYVGFAMDVYGEGKTGKNTEENAKLMTPLMEDRQLLRDRLSAAFTHVKTLNMVDENNIAAMGYCFGGLCVLDMARAGLDLKGVLSFHGLLSAPENIPNQKIKAKILALHGHEDPMVPPAQVALFEKEMTDAKVDWQVHVYGNTKHAFTNPQAQDTELGLIYNALAD